MELIKIDFYNVRIKRYNDNQKQITVYSSTIKIGLTSVNKGKKVVKTNFANMSINDISKRILMNFKRSSRRSKNMIYDIARSNTWDWFITLTFDPQKVDSFDYAICTKKLSRWIDTIRRKCGSDFKYILIPELHKSGRYHFHGLFANCDNLDFIESGVVTKDLQMIYNIGNYRLGFTTATRIVDTKKASSYIAKYVTKELSAVTKGKRKYWASRNCDKPIVEKLCIDKVLHNTDLHDTLLSDSSLVFLKEDINLDREGNEGYIRYYEFEKGVIK